MPTIARVVSVHSIKVGPSSTVLADGTIVDPIPYEGALITFVDGVVVGVELPLTDAKVYAAWLAATQQAKTAFGGLQTGQTITGP